jgi:cell division protein FtsL
MVRRSTLIVLIIFILLAAGAILLPRLQKQEEEQTATPTTAPTQPLIYSQSMPGMLWIQFADAAGNQVAVERATVDEDWVLVGESDGTSDSARISSVAGQLLAMRASRTFDTDLGVGDVGLNNPAYTITIRTTTGEEIVTKIGNLTAVGNGYYIQVDDEPVVIVAKLVLDEILRILTEPPLLPTPTPEVTEILVPEGEPTPTP